jgi:cap2 methyltransferase
MPSEHTFYFWRSLAIYLTVACISCRCMKLDAICSSRAHPYRRKMDATENHPHCMEAGTPLQVSGFQEILCHGHFPRRKYVPRDQGQALSILHLGQRKLLMSEIGALLHLNPEAQYVAVYAGAAPGIHTPLLSKLFPNVVFHLYDPAPFQIQETDRIRLFNVCFTDEIAQTYAQGNNKNMVFICDIRRTWNEQMVWEDMLSQKRWHETMQPVLTSLKFRLPWPGNGVIDTSNQVEYLNGDIYLPIWGPRSTTESRLVIKQGLHARNSTRIYDCLAYEEEMCYFNRVMRPSIHLCQTVRSWGLDGCYDCTAEVRLLDKYRKVWPHTKISSNIISHELRRGIRRG